MMACCEGDATEKRKMSRTMKYVRRKLDAGDLSFMPIYNEEAA